MQYTFQVASFTDAWIETSTPVSIRFEKQVASFTDAWIETYKEDVKRLEKQSHLLQMRGLKLQFTPACSLTNCRIFYRCVD